MKTRVITGTLLAIFFIPIFILGGYFLDVTLLILTGAATYELRKMFNRTEKLHDYVTIIEIILSAGLFFLLSYIFKGELEVAFAFLYIVTVIIIGALLSVFDEKYTTIHFGNTLISVLYPAIGFAAISMLRFDSIYSIGFLFAVTIFTDIFAYIVGVNFGKHRLAEKISPKKSIEGSIGGIVFAIIFTILFLLAFDVDSVGNIYLSIVNSIILIFVLSIVGQIGDLIASKFKRDYGIKDYSNLFPGHGGVMDRFDSAIFAAMVLMLISEVVGLLWIYLS